MIKLHDCMMDDADTFLIIEYCNGGNPLQRLMLMSDATEQIIAEYFKQMVEAIKCCWDEKIFHKTLKPEVQWVSKLEKGN